MMVLSRKLIRECQGIMLATQDANCDWSEEARHDEGLRRVASLLRGMLDDESVSMGALDEWFSIIGIDP